MCGTISTYLPSGLFSSLTHTGCHGFASFQSFPLGEALEQDEKHEKTFVFMKEKGEYIYRGVFEKDLNDCNEVQTVWGLCA